MSNYKEAIFLGVTFPTNKGVLNISQLPGLSLTDLSISLKTLKKQLEKEENSELDFLDDSKTVDKTLELQFEILKDVYLTKKKDNEDRRNALQDRERRNKIISLIEKKKDESLESKSIDELENLLK